MPIASRSFDDEAAAYAAEQDRRRALAQGTTADMAPVAARLAYIKSNYPQMRASLALAAAQSNLADNELKLLWDREVEAQAKTASDDRYSGGLFSDALGFIRSAGEGAMRDVIKPATQIGTAAVSFPFELATATIASSTSGLSDALGVENPRYFGQDASGGWRNPFAQTRFGQLAASPTADRGSGFFIGGDVEDRAYSAQRDAMTLYQDAGYAERYGGGRSFTPGRAFFGAVDGTPGRVLEGVTDAYMTLRADPASAIGATSRSVQTARRTVSAADELHEASGLLKAWRTTVHGPTAQAWLDGAQGQRVTQSFADTSSAYTIWQATGRKIPLEVAKELADEADPALVRKILDRHLGIDVLDRPSEIIDGSTIVRRAFRPETHRLSARLGVNVINPNDLDESALALERSMIQAKVDIADRAKVIDKLAGATGRDAKYRAIGEYVAQVRNAIVGKDPLRPDLTRAQEDLLDQHLQLFNRNVGFAREYAVDALGQPLSHKVVTVNGRAVEVGQGPLAYTEMLNSRVPLPDVRALKQLSSTARRLTALAVHVGDDARAVSLWDAIVLNPLDKINHVWRSSVLLRFGATVRNVSEAQFSMAASGFSSPYRHPLEWIGYVVSRKNPNAIVERTLDGRSWIEAAGDDATEIARNTVNAERLNHAKTFGREMTGTHIMYRAGDRYFAQSYAEEIARMASDPIEQKIAAALASTDPARALRDLEDDLWSGPLQKFRRDLIDPTAIDPAVGPTRLRQTLDTRDGWRAYFNEVAVQRVHETAAGDRRILDAISSRRFVDDDGVAHLVSDGKTVAKPLVRHTRQMEKDGVGVEAVMGREWISTPAAKQRSHFYDRAYDGLWNMLYAAPSNKFANHPGFKEAYARHLGRLHAYADDATQEAIAAYVPRKTFARSRNPGAALPADVERLTMAEVDRIAQRRALDDVKKVFYDLSSNEKVSGWDTLRYIVPFGAAWQDTLTRWSRYVREDPTVMRRFHQGLQSAKSSGIVTEDPQTGELMINTPVSTLPLGVGGQIPLGFQGRVAGLNMVAQVYPGVGPMLAVPVALAASTFDTPGWDALREVVSPFSDGGDGVVEETLDALTPGWMDRIRTAFDPAEGQQRQRNNQIARNIQYLESSGEYDLSNPDEVREMVERASDAVSTQFFLRGIFQWLAPTAPSFDPQVKTKDGRLADLYVMADEMHKLQEEYRDSGDPDGYLDEFYARYGPNMTTMLQPLSYATTYGISPTKEFDRWYTSHKDAFAKYADVAGLFAPGEGDFDFGAFNRQIDNGQLGSYFDGSERSFQEWVSIAQNRIGQVQYREALKVLASRATGGYDPSKDPAVLNALQAELYARLPGWNRRDLIGKRSKLAPPDAIEQIARMAEDDAMADIPGMDSVKSYLAAREEAFAEIARYNASASPGDQISVDTSGRPSIPSSAVALPIRLWLAQVGNELILRDPYFSRMWTDLFAREGNIGDAFAEYEGQDADTSATAERDPVLNG